MTLVRDIMTRTVDTLPPEATIGEAARHMRDGDFGVLPMAENNRLVGVLTDRDIVVRGVAEGNADAAPAREVMTDRVLYCFDDQDCREVADNMRELQVRRLPVVDRDKRLVGILSIGDLAVETDKTMAGQALEGVSR